MGGGRLREVVAMRELTVVPYFLSEILITERLNGLCHTIFSNVFHSKLKHVFASIEFQK